MSPRVLFLVSLLLLGLAQIARAEPVVVERDTPLLAEPRADAPVRATLKQGTRGDATTKQGPWVALKTPAGAGWVLSFNLNWGAGTSGGAGIDASTVNRLTSRQKPNVTPTIGVRGIEKEDLQRAQFNAQQMALFEKYRATEAQAKASASSSGLRAQQLDYLD